MSIISTPGIFTVSDPTGGGVSLGNFVAHGYKWITYQAVNYPSTASPSLAPAKAAGFNNVGIWGVVYNNADFFAFGAALAGQALALDAQHVIVDAEEVLKNTRPGGAAQIIAGLVSGGWNGPVHLSTLGAPSNPTVNDFAMDIQSFLNTGGGILPQAYSNETRDYDPANCRIYWERMGVASNNINYTIATYTGALGHLSGSDWIPLLSAAGVTTNFSIFLGETTSGFDLISLDVFSEGSASTPPTPPPPAPGFVSWEAEHSGSLAADYDTNSGASLSGGELVASGAGLSYATKNLTAHRVTGHYARFYARRISGGTTAPIGLFRCRSATPDADGRHAVYGLFIKDSLLQFGVSFPEDVIGGTIQGAGAQVWGTYTVDDTYPICVEVFYRAGGNDGPDNGVKRIQVLVNGSPVGGYDTGGGISGGWLPDFFDVGFWCHQGSAAAEWRFDHVAVRDDPQEGLWGPYGTSGKRIYLLRGFENAELQSNAGFFPADTLEVPLGGTGAVPPAIVPSAPGPSPTGRPGYALDCAHSGFPQKVRGVTWGNSGSPGPDSAYNGPDPAFGSRAAYSYYFKLGSYPTGGFFGTPFFCTLSFLLAPPDGTPGGGGLPLPFASDAAGILMIDSEGWLCAAPELFNATTRTFFGFTIFDQNPRRFRLNKVSLNRWHHVEVLVDTTTPGAWKMQTRLNGVDMGTQVGDTSSAWDTSNPGQFASYGRWQSPALSLLEVGKLDAIDLDVQFKDVCAYHPSDFPLHGTTIRARVPSGPGTHNAEVPPWAEGLPPFDLQQEQFVLVGANQNFDQGTWDSCGQPTGWSASANASRFPYYSQPSGLPYIGTLDSGCNHCASLVTGNPAIACVVEGPDGDEPPEIAGFNHVTVTCSDAGAQQVHMCPTGLDHTGRLTFFAWVKESGGAYVDGMSVGDAFDDAFTSGTSVHTVKIVGAWRLVRFDQTRVNVGPLPKLVFGLVGGDLTVFKMAGLRLYYDYIESPSVAGFWKSSDSGATSLAIQNNDADSNTYIDELPASGADIIGVSRNPLNLGQEGYATWTGKYVEYQQEDAAVEPLAARFYVKGNGWTFDTIPPTPNVRSLGLGSAAMHFRIVDPDLAVERRLDFTNIGGPDGRWSSAMMSLADDIAAWTLDRWNRLRWRVGYQDDRSSPSAVIFSQHFELLLPEAELPAEPRPSDDGKTGGVHLHASFRAAEPGSQLPADPGTVSVALDKISFRSSGG